jgi:sterol desaturase/sphingolipid hydroxylase (fatty acid hydroxylase superfamily)
VTTFALLASAGASLLFLLAVFAPLERAFPARPEQPFFRPRWGTDLVFLLGQYLVWNGVVLAALQPIGRALSGLASASLRDAIAAQPFALQILEVVIASDLCVYWGHRLQHRVNFLWRFHAVHHSAERLDWLAAHREHPVDTVYTLTLINLPALVLGFPTASIAALVAFRGLWAVYIHSNVRLPLGPFRVLFGSPELHHWHHARSRDAGNYANVSPLMDVLFGTYRFPDHEPEALGLPYPYPASYLGQMVQPFRPRKRRVRGPAPASAPAEAPRERLVAV